MKNNTIFLTRVTLSGFKTIKEVDVEFKNGLNIIIGKNAVGKTNFFNFLIEILNYSFDKFDNFTSQTTFSGELGFTVKSARSLNTENSTTLKQITKTEAQTSISIAGRKKEYSINNFDEYFNFFNMHKFSIIPSFIRHGIPQPYPTLSSPFSYDIDNTGFSSTFYSIISNLERPYFLRFLLANLQFMGQQPLINSTNELNVEQIKSDILDVFNEVNVVKELLKKFSPIEDIRFNKNINIFPNENNNTFSVTNLFIEFKISGNWHPFENLSDGTKRLFYIISEVGTPSKLINIPTGYSIRDFESNRIILIEEPELGIHPHQLMKLMEFLKLESETKQIIVTSHSPIILDVLNKNELERIIIATKDSDSFGTKLNHLEQAKIEKAKLYLEEDFLSDYWKHSDLEN